MHSIAIHLLSGYLRLSVAKLSLKS